MRRMWTQSEIDKVVELYPTHYTKDISAILGRSDRSVYGIAHKLGLKKDEEFRSREYAIQAARLKKSGAAFRFTKGFSPVNKGKKMNLDVYEKVKHTFFKKGRTPLNAYPEGTEVIRSDSGKQYRMIKVPGIKKLVYKHTYLWATSVGDIPKGYNIVFRDNDSLNCTLDNLECISDKQLLERNSIVRYPKEVRSVLYQISKLNKKIKDAKK